MVIDIETVPGFQNLAEAPEPIQKLWDKKTKTLRGDQSVDKLYLRAGIYAEFGKIICLSMGVFTGQNQTTAFRVKSLYGENEYAILDEFKSILNSQPVTLVLCAHNGKEFDFPYLCRRMIVNRISIPEQLNIQGKKPWEIQHLDTLDMWKFGDYKHYTSLDLLSTVLGIPTPKNDLHGADVHRVYWEEGNILKIKHYCERDIIATAKILMRLLNKEPFDDNEVNIAN